MLISSQRVWHVAYVVGLLAGLMISYTLLFRHELSAEGTKERIEEKLVPIRYSFQQKLPFQDVVKNSFFTLAPIERSLRLPDLRSAVSFLGCNERPDLSLEKMRVQFSLRGSAPANAVVDEKVYLRFDSHTNKYVVSEKASSLSISFHPRDGGADVTVEIKDESGKVVKTPKELHRYFVNLSSSPQIGTSAQTKWEVGAFVADPMLLEKQEARWYGKDEMILTLGGEEYSYESARERVQFGTGADAYVLWIKEGDSFVYSDGGWRAAELGSETKGKILLRTRKVDDRQIQFDLWNSDGSLRVGCSLARRESRTGKKVPDIRIIGARSQKLWITEVDRKRMALSPSDWIVCTDEGVTKIDSEKELEKYIEGVSFGSFIAFTGIKKVNNESCLTGVFFDSTRTSKEEIAVPLYRSLSTNKPSSSKSVSKEMDDEDDEDDEMDEEDEDPFSDEIDDEDDES